MSVRRFFTRHNFLLSENSLIRPWKIKCWFTTLLSVLDIRILRSTLFYHTHAGVVIKITPPAHSFYNSNPSVIPFSIFISLLT